MTIKASKHALEYVFGIMKDTELERITRRCLGEGKKVVLANPVEAHSPTPLQADDVFFDFDRDGKFIRCFTMKDGKIID